MMPRKIEISHRTIIFTILLLLGLWFLYFVRDIILQLFVALLLMTILEPLVVLLTRIKIPRAISVLITYILVLGLFGGVVALIAPALAQQTTNFVNTLPFYLANIKISPSISGDLIRGIMAQLGGIPGDLLNFTFSVFSNALSVVTVLIFAFYMLLTHDKLQDQTGFLFGETRKEQIGRLIGAWENKLGKWARGQLLLMLSIGLGTYLGLVLIGIPFALPLAILAGILEIIPILGPIFSAIPAIIIGFGISPVIGLGVTAVAFLVHQLEGYVLVPKIMEKSVGVSPLLILISITIGAKLLGVMGVIISVPFVITLQVLIKEYLVTKE
ncbi:MAG TPA: AI-2E family transporter [Candidatus Saccharimonadales bacterium]|nr:AI-2E family transporter [Candidatus Saccharimonadales bacterium]